MLNTVQSTNKYSEFSRPSEQKGWWSFLAKPVAVVTSIGCATLIATNLLPTIPAESGPMTPMSNTTQMSVTVLQSGSNELLSSAAQVLFCNLGLALGGLGSFVSGDIKPLLMGAMSCFGTANAQQPPRVQVDPILAGISILAPEQSSRPIFAVTWKQNKTTDDGRFTLPDEGISYMPDTICRHEATAETFASFEEYKKSQSSQISVSLKYKLFSGSLSQSQQNVAIQILRNNMVVTSSKATCSVYQLFTEPGLTPLDPYFAMRAMELPTVYNASSTEIFNNFFDDFGTHPISSAKLGGEMKQTAFSTFSYYKSTDKHTIETQAQAVFYASFSGSSNYSSNLTRQYQTNTVTDSIEFRGGSAPSSTTWTEWTKEIFALPNYRNSMELISLPDFFENYAGIPALAERANALREALMAYLDRPGCTDPRAENYNTSATVNDTSCEMPNYPSFCPSCQITGGAGSCSTTGNDCSIGTAESCTWGGGIRCQCGNYFDSAVGISSFESLPKGPHTYCGNESLVIDPSQQCASISGGRDGDVVNIAICCPPNSIANCSQSGCNCS